MGRPTDDKEVHDIVSLELMCKEYSALPHEGGILDQDQLIVRKLLMVERARAKKDKLEREKKERERKRTGK